MNDRDLLHRAAVALSQALGWQEDSTGSITIHYRDGVPASVDCVERTRLRDLRGQEGGAG